MAGNGSSVDLKYARRRKGQLVEESILKRLPPHSIEAEQGVLGCVLLGGSESYAEVSSVVTAEDYFYDERHKMIYGAMKSLFLARVPIDVIMLQTMLRKASSLEMVGGLTYLNSLPETVPSAANWQYYADKVADKWFLRTIIQKCQSAVTDAYDNTEDSEDVISQLERDILAIGQSRRGCKSLHTAAEITREYLNALDDGWINGIVSYKTGYPDLDRIIGSFRPGHFVVIAAVPAAGKSSLTANIVANHCSQGTPVGVVTMEMSARQWMEQIYALETGISTRSMELGGFDDKTMAEVSKIMAKVSKWPLYILDDGKKTIEQIEAQARQWITKHGIKILVLDYLQIIKSAKKFENATTLATHVSNSAKAMARELNIPVIVCASMNRESRKANTRPQTWEIRQSGSIESDADTIMLLHPAKDDLISVIVAKNRFGPEDTATLRFRKSIKRFESVDI